jgi:beta-glucanase (GH16 family)
MEDRSALICGELFDYSTTNQVNMYRIMPYWLFLFMVACAKGSSGGGSGGNNTASVSAKLSGTSVARQFYNNNARFYVDLSAASKSAATVSYTTVDGTAKAGTDYIAATGAVTIPAGQTEGYIDITVVGDSLRQNTQAFQVQLSSPVNCTVSVDTASAIITNDGTYLPTNDSGYTTPAAYAGYTLAWSDEFNDTVLNPHNWNYEINGNGEGNQELEYYTNRAQNLFLSGGNLIIEARRESYAGANYTSARIDTYGKQSFTYGRIDIRAKLPVAQGMWPALWMLGNNINTGVAWPGCGEMDIMELIGTYPSQVTGSIHWLQSGGSEGTFNNNYDLSAGRDFSQAFHVFSEVWTADSVQYLIDDNVYVRASYQTNVTSGVNPFNSPFFFIFNVAVGGNWPGSPGATTVFPQRLFVDYVRVFQKN